MMHKNNIIPALLFLSLSIIYIASCKKDSATDPTTPGISCVADSGGTKTIIARLEHHTVNIPNQVSNPDTVWVKFNASNWSDAPNNYSIRFIGVGGEDHINLTNLKCGNYFLYAAGYDTSISSPVFGGINVVLSTTDSVVTKAIPVTE